jgi:hypothetical protein
LRRFDVEVEPLGAAWRFGAGSSPLLADLHRREDVSAYRALDRALRSVRASGGVHFLPPWDEETTAEWLSRFQVAENDGSPVSRPVAVTDR